MFHKAKIEWMNILVKFCVDFGRDVDRTALRITATMIKAMDKLIGIRNLFRRYQLEIQKFVQK